MGSLVRDALIFIGIQLAAAVLLTIYTSPSRNDFYLAANLDKQRRLEEVSPPRIILIGGSNLTFGVNSGLIQKYTGMSVVNMGLHAGLGLPFMLSEVKEQLRSGDIVVISPEYAHLWRNVTSQVAPLVFLHRPQAVMDFTVWVEWQALLDGGHVPIRSLLHAGFRQTVDYVKRHPSSSSMSARLYARSAFNEYGDVVRHWERPASGPGRPTALLFQPEYEKKIIRTMNRFHEYCAERGITVLFSYPQYPESHALGERRIILKELADMLDEQLEFPVLNRPEGLLLPDELFFNTTYHLTREGTRKRTEILVESLREYSR